jgi:hypothetical protein
MAYRDINLSNQPRAYKENLVPVLSDLVGETEGQGKIDNFIDDSMSNLKMPSNIKSDPHEVKFNADHSKLLDLYKSKTDNCKRWLTLMGLIERKIMQLRCYKNPTLAFSIQEQKSGDNFFRYIVIRAPFIDLYTGKKEIRRYHTKLEDYPKFNSLEELKSDPVFLSEAITEIKDIMAQQINKEDITLEYLESQLRSLEKDSYDRYIIERTEKLFLEKEHEALKSKMEQENKISQELEKEEARYNLEIRAIKQSNEDASFKELLLKKSKDEHRSRMDRIKNKSNLNL